MIELVTERASELAELCRRHRVQRLDLFGSAATSQFDERHSDLDFIVSFRPEARVGYTSEFFQLQEELERLFGRKVDLLFDMEFRNPHLRTAIDETRILIYEA